jgi:hypothetical protein
VLTQQEAVWETEPAWALALNHTNFIYLPGIERRVLGKPILSLVFLPITSQGTPHVLEKALNILENYCQRQLSENEN